MTELSELAALVERLAGVRALCVGDAMLDRFVYGKVDRISPEAPVPVLYIESERAMLGGAGNVVRNLTALGADVCFVSAIGRDAAGRELTGLIAREMSVESHLLTDAERATTIKTRYVAGAQQLLRADSERVAPVSAHMEEDMLTRAGVDLEDSAALILSDYGKGVLTDRMLSRLISAASARNRPIVVDPKGSDYSRYEGADLVTPNRAELAEATGLPVGDDDQIVAAARHVIEDCGVKAVLVTRSQDGMTLVTADDIFHAAARAREVYDVSGAGDTVVAMMGVALGAGIELEDAMHLANAAAGVVVAKMGTAVARSTEVVAALHARDLLSGEDKTMNLANLLGRIEDWREQGFRVGFTNGCFDLLHPGHVSLINQAKAGCDRLIVGLNSDASVARLKGEDRPLQSEAARAVVLASLGAVDAVVIFSEDTPLEVIGQIRPDVLVKGADYTVETVVGADVVQSYGGEVLLARLEDGFSTTRLVERSAVGRSAVERSAVERSTAGR